MLDKQGAVGLAKPTDRPDHDVDDPLFLMTLTIPQLFLKPLHMTETSMRAGNVDVYNWMQNSKRDVYLGAYLNGAHWQMIIILPKENVVIWFCSLHNRPDNYLKGIITRNINILIVQQASIFVFNGALKGLNDTPQSKSKVAARWIVVKYFNDARPLEPKRLKVFRIQLTKYYLKLKNET
ncbi:hypothetical protein GmHk_16G046055 [Glycine max]|nr:hypothetical protein GmHk_16G046055 [Glycine max]